MNRNESEEAKTEGERLLRELCEVCPGEWVWVTMPLGICKHDNMSRLQAMEDGSVVGPYALWSMLQEMRERVLFLHMQVSPSSPESDWEELGSMEQFFFYGNPSTVTAENILTNYIAWKRVCLPTALASKTENL